MITAALVVGLLALLWTDKRNGAAFGGAAVAITALLLLAFA